MTAVDTRPSPPSPLGLWTGLGLVYVVWGSTYLAIRYVVVSLPPLLSASVRFAVASLLLLGYLAVRRGRPAFVVTARQLAGAAVVGLLLLLGGNGGVTLSEQRGVPSGLTALLVAAVPLFVVLLRALSHDRPTPRTLLGVAIGFVGVAVLLLPGGRPQGVPVLAAGLVVASSGLWALGSFLASRLDLPADGLLSTVAQMTGGGVGLALAGLLRGERLDASQVRLSSVLALAYLVVFGSIVAFTAYAWLLRVAPVSKVSTYAYVNPVVAVGLGALFAGEQVGLVTAVGGAVTVLAVAVVVSEQSRRRRDEPVEVGGVEPGPSDVQLPVDRQGRDRSSAT